MLAFHNPTSLFCKSATLSCFLCREVSVRDLKIVVSKAVMPRDMRVLVMQVNVVTLL